MANVLRKCDKIKNIQGFEHASLMAGCHATSEDLDNG